MNEYLEPGEEQENNQPDKNEKASDDSTAAQGENELGSKENLAKRKKFKVLHEDGSLADIPYSNQPGGGAMEGTIGIGT